MMNVEAIQEATKGLEKVTKKVSGIIETKDGIESLSNKPAMEFLPVMQIYAKLLTQHSLTDIKEYDDLIKVQAPNSGEETENAIEALWAAEENYENLLKKVNRVLNLQVPKTISKIGELAPLGAMLTNVRNSDQILSLDQLLDEEEEVHQSAPKYLHFVLLRHLS